jgi:hypothetical protein
VKTAPCGSLEHPNVMQEDVSEQLTTIEETILKQQSRKKKLLRWL